MTNISFLPICPPPKGRAPGGWFAPSKQLPVFLTKQPLIVLIVRGLKFYLLCLLGYLALPTSQCPSETVFYPLEKHHGNCTGEGAEASLPLSKADVGEELSTRTLDKRAEPGPRSAQTPADPTTPRLCPRCAGPRGWPTALRRI